MHTFILTQGGVRVSEEEMKLLANLLDDKKLYFKKEGKVIIYDMPKFGTASLILMDDKVVRIEENKKISV